MHQQLKKHQESLKEKQTDTTIVVGHTIDDIVQNKQNNLHTLTQQVKNLTRERDQLKKLNEKLVQKAEELQSMIDELRRERDAGRQERDTALAQAHAAAQELRREKQRAQEPRTAEQHAEQDAKQQAERREGEPARLHADAEARSQQPNRPTHSPVRLRRAQKAARATSYETGGGTTAGPPSGALSAEGAAAHVEASSRAAICKGGLSADSFGSPRLVDARDAEIPRKNPVKS